MRIALLVEMIKALEKHNREQRKEHFENHAGYEQALTDLATVIMSNEEVLEELNTEQEEIIYVSDADFDKIKKAESAYIKKPTPAKKEKLIKETKKALKASGRVGA